MVMVTTYGSANQEQINLTPAQERMLTEAGVWPRDSRGDEICRVEHGLHVGDPTHTDNELRTKYIPA